MRSLLSLFLFAALLTSGYWNYQLVLKTRAQATLLAEQSDEIGKLETDLRKGRKQYQAEIQAQEDVLKKIRSDLQAQQEIAVSAKKRLDVIREGGVFPEDVARLD